MNWELRIANFELRIVEIYSDLCNSQVVLNHENLVFWRGMSCWIRFPASRRHL